MEAATQQEEEKPTSKHHVKKKYKHDLSLWSKKNHRKKQFPKTVFLQQFPKIIGVLMKLNQNEEMQFLFHLRIQNSEKP